MYDEILYPTDGSEPATEVLDYALDIAAEHGATVHVLHVADTGRDSLTQIRGEVIDVLETEGERIVAEAAQRVTDRGVPVESVVRQGTPSRSIVEYGSRVDIDLLVMPTHGRSGLKRVLIGSVTERVVTNADVPVVTVNPTRDGPRTYPGRELLVATDGSRAATRAVREGIALANATGARLHILHVVETGVLGPDVRSVLKEGELGGRAPELMAEATEMAAAESLAAVVSEVESGSPATEIRSYIEDNGVDLAVLGTHGVTDFSRYVLGGVSSKLIRTAPVPVMWVRAPEAGD